MATDRKTQSESPDKKANFEIEERREEETTLNVETAWDGPTAAVHKRAQTASDISPFSRHCTGDTCNAKEQKESNSQIAIQTIDWRKKKKEKKESRLAKYLAKVV